MQVIGIDNMRVGGGRCPSILVGALVIACLLLICNRWSLTTENLDLLRQIDELNEQLKISAEERDQCVTLRGNLQQRYKRMEDEAMSLHVRLDQQNDLKKRNDELEDSVAICKSELDSMNKLDSTRTATLETLRLEKDTINSQLDVKREENKKLQEEADQLKDDMAKLKLKCNVVPAKKPDVPLPLTRRVISKTQLGALPESAVKVSVAGQRGLKYHGVPILPSDPPGAVRQAPRFSVTMLKATTTVKQQKNGTHNQRASQVLANIHDLGVPDDSNHGGEGTIDEPAAKEPETPSKKLDGQKP